MVKITNTLDFINGLFSLIVVITSFLVSFLILLKYRKLKNIEYFYWGIGFIGIYMSWWPASLSFIMVLITGNSLNLCYYSTIGVILSPIFLGLWMIGFHKMLFNEKRKITLPLYAIIFILAEIYILYNFFTGNCEVLATFQPGQLFDIKLHGINLIYHAFLIFSVATTGMIDAYKLFKSRERTLRVKACFLTYAFLAHPICGILDAGLDLNVYTLIMVRLAMVAASIFFYIGFFLPTFIKNLLKIEE